MDFVSDCIINWCFYKKYLKFFIYVGIKINLVFFLLFVLILNFVDWYLLNCDV